ncbi:MAG: CHAT domain-containing protein [Porphyrobacter sp.]|nr:CHAT domain-containing protein [Porphyrobacter sp.]
MRVSRQGWRAERRTIAAACALALMMPAGGASAALVAAGPGGEEEVTRLQTEAEALFAEVNGTADGALRIIARWEAVIAAAQRIASDHPAIAPARIRIGSQLYALGRNAEARAAVEQGLAALPKADPALLVVRGEGVALLGTLLAHEGKADAAIAALEAGYADYAASFAALSPADIHRGTIIAKSNLEFSLSQTLLQLSRIDDALRYQRASLDTRETYLGPNDPDTVGSYYGYAGTLRRASQMDEAERYARIAVERAVAHLDPSHQSYARAFEMLGIILSRTGRPVEATGYLARSLELKRAHEGPDSLFFGYGLHLLGTIYHQRERYGDAVPLFEEAAPIFRKYQGEGSPFGLGSEGYAAQGSFALGRPDALARLTAVDARMAASVVDADIAKRIGPDLVRALIRSGAHDEAARIAARDYARLLETEASGVFAVRHARLVDAHARSILSGRPADAVTEAHAMLDVFARNQALVASGLLVAEQRAALDLVMEIAVDSSDADLMAAAIATATGSGLAQASAFRAERLAAGDAGLAEALRALQQADAELDAADRAVLRALAEGGATEAALARLAAADATHKAALDALRQRDVALGRLLAAPDSDVAAIRARLAPGQALLALAPAYDGAYSLLVTADQALVRRLDLPRAELVALAAAVRDSAASADFDAAASARLASVLLPPETRAALDGIAVLRVLAGGALASLPFGMLVLDDSQRGAPPTYLADRFALVSTSSFEPAVKPAGPRGGGLVAFAAPTPFASADAAASSPASALPRGSTAAARLAALPPLPGTEIEARTIAREFGAGRARLFTGPDAAETNLRDSGVASADVLLFATHGLVGGELEGIAEPALVLSKPADQLSDGVLTASEIARLNLTADWVILTACDSAAGFEGGVPAFSGLVSAFRFAGAGSVLATHWQVRDDVAAYVAIEMLRHYRAHGDKARALHHAIDRLRRSSGIAGADRPDIWAPFVLIE